MGYSPQLARIHATGFTELAREAARHLRMRAPSAKRVLDLGCGAGDLAAALPGMHVWGIDLSQAMVEMAQAKVPDGEFVVGSIHGIDFPSAEAAVLCGEVVNYLFDERAADGLELLLRRIHASLPPGGVLLFDVAGPGRADPPTKGQVDGNGWNVEFAAHEEGTLLVRDIISRTPDEAVCEHHKLRLWSDQEVDQALLAAGFRFQRLPGYAGRPLGPGWTVIEAIA